MDNMREAATYQEILLEGKAEGLAEGEIKTANRIALNMLRSGISVNLISQFTGLSLEQIQKLQK